MYRSELAKEVAEKFKLPKARAVKIMKYIDNKVIESLKNNERVEFNRFGSFYTKTHKERTARNLKTGEKCIVPERVVVHFRASKSYRSIPTSQKLIGVK